MLKYYFFILNFLTINCFASEVFTNSKNIEDVLKKDSYEPSYFSLVLGLFLVIALVYLTGFIYQKLIKINVSNTNCDKLNKINIISTTPLGQNKALHIIEINDEYSLIGSSPNNIAFLKDIKNLKRNTENK